MLQFIHSIKRSLLHIIFVYKEYIMHYVKYPTADNINTKLEMLWIVTNFDKLSTFPSK